MERNPNDTFNTQTGGADQGGAGGAGPSDGSFAPGQTGGMNQGIGGTGGGGGTMGANPSGIGNTGDVAGSAGYGAGGYGGSMGTAGAAGTTGTTGTPDDTNLRDRAGDMATGAREKLGDAATQAREKLGDAGDKARDWKHRAERGLADTLERGAERLRQRGQGENGTATGTQAFAGAAGGTATTGAVDEGKLDHLSGNVARGMEATAEWLREGDLRETIETQARSHPGRTLLIALGLGYLLGKSIRR